MPQKTKKPLFSPSNIPHIYNFDYWPFEKFCSNQTLNFFGKLKKSLFNLTWEKGALLSHSIVLEVEKKHDRRGSLRHRALHCPQHLCAVSIPLDVSSSSKRALLFCSEEKSTGVCRGPWEQGHREADNSHSWGSEITVTVSSRIILNCIILEGSYSSCIL